MRRRGTPSKDDIDANGGVATRTRAAASAVAAAESTAKSTRTPFLARLYNVFEKSISIVMVFALCGFVLNLAIQKAIDERNVPSSFFTLSVFNAASERNESVNVYCHALNASSAAATRRYSLRYLIFLGGGMPLATMMPLAAELGSGACIYERQRGNGIVGVKLSTQNITSEALAVHTALISKFGGGGGGGGGVVYVGHSFGATAALLSVHSLQTNTDKDSIMKATSALPSVRTLVLIDPMMTNSWQCEIGDAFRRGSDRLGRVAEVFSLLGVSRLLALLDFDFMDCLPHLRAYEKKEHAKVASGLISGAYKRQLALSSHYAKALTELEAFLSISTDVFNALGVNGTKAVFDDDGHSLALQEELSELKGKAFILRRTPVLFVLSDWKITRALPGCTTEDEIRSFHGRQVSHELIIQPSSPFITDNQVEFALIHNTSHLLVHEDPHSVAERVKLFTKSL